LIERWNNQTVDEVDLSPISATEQLSERYST